MAESENHSNELSLLQSLLAEKLDTLIALQMETLDTLKELAAARSDPRPEPPHPAATSDADPHYGVTDTVLKGKYSGKATSWVVKNDPWYLEWMHREGIDYTAFGFTTEEFTDAVAAAKSRPQPGRR